MKKLAQPTRSFFTLKISWKSSPGWLQLVFHFGTENREEQLKKPPCITCRAMCCCGGSDDDHRRRRHESEEDGCFDCCLCAPCRFSQLITLVRFLFVLLRWLFSLVSCILCCGCCCNKEEEHHHGHHRVGKPIFISTCIVSQNGNIVILALSDISKICF